MILNTGKQWGREKIKKIIYIYFFVVVVVVVVVFWSNQKVLLCGCHFYQLKHCKEVHYKALFKID